MTREEAVEILWQYDVNFEPHPAEDVMHAIDMAIEALEKEETLQNLTKPNKSDLISRQDVIDGLEYEVELCNRALDDMDIDRKERDRFEWELELVKRFIEDIKELPSKDRPKWIPCSERMPKEREWIGTEKFGTTISDKVLVTFESRGERFVKPMKFQNRELGGMDKHTMDVFYDEWEAIAWMPFPKAYREDGEENE